MSIRPFRIERKISGWHLSCGHLSCEAPGNLVCEAPGNLECEAPAGRVPRKRCLTLFSRSWLTIAVLIFVMASGCRATSPSDADRTLSKRAREADLAFQAGDDERAISRYRLALRRAWEIDDVEGIANVAFNLAGCLATIGEYEWARQALAEVRAALVRGELGQADVWLLEAKIARAQGRLEEAAYLADCVVEPMIRNAPECRDGKCLAGKSSESSAGDKLRDRLTRDWGGKWRQKKRQRHADQEACQTGRVELALFRANVSLDRGDVERARIELAKGRGDLTERPEPALRAEIAATESRLLIQLDRPLEAARRLDQEVEWLKAAEHYRELPMASVAAATAYLQADEPLIAADRLLRAARVLYGRDDLLAALHFLEQAVELASEFEDGDLQQRAALLLGEIEYVHQRSARRDDPVEPDHDLPAPIPPLSPWGENRID